jgi:hypothetical protein
LIYIIIKPIDASTPSESGKVLILPPPPGHLIINLFDNKVSPYTDNLPEIILSLTTDTLLYTKQLPFNSTSLEALL